ncbi:hypothetical protein T459_29896 [Capsicum annuum]|uniref:Uncharacterized protein n=1 Tax=Capsicum annuum TaxID=4072 RepID=A0A2G2Y7C8_CAPAN|nr:hypothetical protein T459_29896 [Capsicum annuum]
MPETTTANTRNGELRQEVDELREQTRIQEIRQLLITIVANQVPQKADGPVENAPTGIPGNPNWQGDRFQRVEFSKFYGDDIKGWAYKTEQYFEYMTTPEGKKVQTTIIYMEGKALQWR